MIYIFGELKKPLLYKNIVIPNMGPIPNIKRTNFAEFFVLFLKVKVSDIYKT